MDLILIAVAMLALALVGAWAWGRLKRAEQRMKAEEQAFSSDILTQRAIDQLKAAREAEERAKGGLGAGEGLRAADGIGAGATSAAAAPVSARSFEAESGTTGPADSRLAAPQLESQSAAIAQPATAPPGFRDDVLMRLEAGRLIDAVEGPLRTAGAGLQIGVTVRLKDGRKIGILDAAPTDAGPGLDPYLRHLDGLIVPQPIVPPDHSVPEPLFVRRLADLITDSVQL